MSRDFSRDGSLSDREPKDRSPATRVRIPTEKELSYSKELAEKELSRVLRTWRTKIEVTKKALADDADLILFQETRATLEVCMNDVAGAYDKQRNLVSDEDEARELSGRFELWREQYEGHFIAVNQKIDELCLGHEKRGLTGSMRSSRTSRTSRSSSSSRKARMLSKEARLKAELNFRQIEKEKEIEL